MVHISTDGDGVVLAAPFHPQLPAKAKAIGGRWDRQRQHWRFPARSRQRVHRLAIEIYGTDGQPTETVTAHVDLSRFDQTEAAIWFAGREIAHRWDRDEPVRLGQGVAIISGTFPARGGSRQYPSIADGLTEGDRAQVVVEVQGVPVGHPDLTLPGVMVADQPETERDALRAERDRLLARVAEIDEQLAALDPTTTDMQQRS